MSTPSSGTRNAASRAPADAGSEALFDELDALLQRMLALPVEPSDRPDDAPASVEDEILDELPLITVAEAAPLAYLEAPPVAPPPAPRVEPPLPKPAPRVEQPPVRAENVLPPPTPLPPAAPEVRAEPPAEEPHEVVAPDTGPVAWINDCFDRLTIPLGYTGRWLRLGFGRTLIGWLGLAMLAAAGGLLLWGCLDWTR